MLDPSYVPGYRNSVDCFLFCCALESSCLGRLSAIRVQLELEFTVHFLINQIIKRHALQFILGV